jgi:hypothetical protein
MAPRCAAVVVSASQFFFRRYKDRISPNLITGITPGSIRNQWQARTIARTTEERMVKPVILVAGHTAEVRGSRDNENT